MRRAKKAALIRELDRLWQGVPSGSQPKCKSPFGVYDMTGNVDECTQSMSATRAVQHPQGRLLGPGAHALPSGDTSHTRPTRFYQQGFRCCQNNL